MMKMGVRPSARTSAKRSLGSGTRLSTSALYELTVERPSSLATAE